MAGPTRSGTSQAGPDIQGMPRVTSYAEAEEILRSPAFASVLHARDSAAIVADNVLTLSGEAHRQRRREEGNVVSSRALRGYERDVLLPSLELAFGIADGQRGPDGLVRVDLLDLARTALVHVTAAVIGLDGVDDAATASDLQIIAKEIGEGVSVEWTVGDHREVIQAALAARERFVREHYASALARRRELTEQVDRGELTEEDLPLDLLTTLLRHHASDWDDELWQREAAFYLVASANTTTYAVPHVLAELLGWLDSHPEDRSRCEELAFLQRVANEALRLHFPVPALPRRALRDVTIRTSGRRIPEGGHVAVDLHAANRDPEVFGSDADRFDPHREVADPRRPFGLTFGAGPHRCPGRPLAVGDPTRPVHDEEPVAGAVVRLLHDLMRSGAELDPEDPPRLRTDTAQAKYERFPLVLTRR